MSLSPKDFLKDQFAKLKVTPVSLAGKTIVVTGSNVGIGYGTVCHLVAMGPSRVILACRNMSKAEEAIRRIKMSTNTDDVVIEAQELNLASFASCRALLSGVKRVIELTKLLQVRYQPPRNEVHHWTHFSEKDTPSIVKAMDDATNTASIKDRYQVTKLMNVLFTRSLARHLQESVRSEDRKITVQVINPGLVSSELGKKEDEPLLQRIGSTIVHGILGGILARNIVEGSKSTVYASVAPECGIENGAQSGQYYTIRRVALPRSTQ
ncbi:hypothetical protein BG000_011038 [Podila horticola]|nr:hypothetical protein BG000_011038 [Podila horticola]